MGDRQTDIHRVMPVVWLKIRGTSINTFSVFYVFKFVDSLSLFTHLFTYERTYLCAYLCSYLLLYLDPLLVSTELQRILPEMCTGKKIT